MSEGILELVSDDSKMLTIINASALAEMLSLPDAVELVRLAMQELSTGLVSAPHRTAFPIASNGTLVMMPGAMTHIARFGIKVLSLFPATVRGDLPGHQGAMLLFDSESGRLLCVIDSHAITALRTAAASAVATQVLSQPKSSSLALLGCGSLASLHLEAMLLVRPIKDIYVWSRSQEKAKAFAKHWSDRVPAKVTSLASAREGIERAEIVCTLTASKSPILEGQWLRPGQHLNLVGASTRAAREVDDEAVARGYYVADCRSHAIEQAGELRHAIKTARIGEGHIAAEIGEILAGLKPGRTSSSAITIYKSLGHVAQDIRVANALVDRLNRSTRVIQVPWMAHAEAE